MISNIGFALLLIWGATVSVQAQGSMYQDNKAQQVGDIITVVLQENISGSTSSDAQNANNAKAGAGGSMGGNFMPFQPTFGSDVEVNYDSDERNQTNQGQLLNGYMSVEITDMTDAGNLIIKGSRSTEINGEKHMIDLTGMVRPKDINGRNQVLSYRVGNAKINYEKEGGLDRIKKKEGFIKKAVLTGVGIALGAAAVMKAMN
ncbi:flagellar basal body L-ring protein FlgH [Aliifodinibius halophilus]|uniref:Flagellar basal body L-ring protein FlgH n=1 Tax=Fodinibius halophilus TaxID=1736908 RepID=A0A6M1T8D0_9BACT|nr:flagellar basal body L-ring protein FlgH [Fodinibius halophilus]